MVQSIYRTKGLSNYTQISNQFLQSGDLDVEEVGVLAKVLSYPAQWQFCQSWFVRTFNIGRSRLKRILDSLRAKGYLYTFQERAGRFFGKFRYIFYESPERNPYKSRRVDKKDIFINLSEQESEDFIKFTEVDAEPSVSGGFVEDLVEEVVDKVEDFIKPEPSPNPNPLPEPEPPKEKEELQVTDTVIIPEVVTEPVKEEKQIAVVSKEDLEKRAEYSATWALQRRISSDLKRDAREYHQANARRVNEATYHLEFAEEVGQDPKKIRKEFQEFLLEAVTERKGPKDPIGYAAAIQRSLVEDSEAATLNLYWVEFCERYKDAIEAGKKFDPIKAAIPKTDKERRENTTVDQLVCYCISAKSSGDIANYWIDGIDVNSIQIRFPHSETPVWAIYHVEKLRKIWKRNGHDKLPPDTEVDFT
jgi:hypothetical protein